MTENLTRGTITNLKWTYGGSAVSAVLQLAYTAVMGRLLTPADFGIVAMALVFLRFGTYFAEMGVGPALVQRTSLSDREIRAGHTSGVLLGLLFGAALAIAAPLARLLFPGTPAVVGVVQLMALSFLFNGAGLTAVSLLRRELRFRELAVIEVVSYCVGYLLVGVLFALNGAGFYSLVAAALGQALLQTVLAYVVVRHPVMPLLAWRELRDLYGFGGQVTVISFLEFLGYSLDAFIVGRYAGEAALGQYNRALLLINLPFQRLMAGFSNVLFATVSRIQTEIPRIRGAYLSALRVAAALLLPTAAGVAVASNELVRVVLGPQWDEAAAVLPLLALAMALDVLSLLGATVCEALAVLRRKLWLQLGFDAVLAALLVANIGGTLRGFAAAVAVSHLLRLGGYVLLMGRILDVELLEHLRSFAGPLLGAAAVAGAIALVRAALLPTAFPLVALLAVQILTGALVLTGLLAVGPLATIRREATTRLVQAGYFGGEGGSGRLVGRLLR